jgi:hypothetical protein
MPAERQTRVVMAMARYRMSVVFDVHEDVKMKYVVRQMMDGESEISIQPYEQRQPHINKLYEDVLERIETSPKYPITYDILSFEKLKEE